MNHAKIKMHKTNPYAKLFPRKAGNNSNYILYF
jgi:hypothetical protein